jgi:hypothetical protein
MRRPTVSSAGWNAGGTNGPPKGAVDPHIGAPAVTWNAGDANGPPNGAVDPHIGAPAVPWNAGGTTEDPWDG